MWALAAVFKLSEQRCRCLCDGIAGAVAGFVLCTCTMTMHAWVMPVLGGSSSAQLWLSGVLLLVLRIVCLSRGAFFLGRLP